MLRPLHQPLYAHILSTWLFSLRHWSCASILLCIEGTSVNSFIAPMSCPVYTMRGKLVFNQLAPPVICEYIYTRTCSFSLYSQIHRLYTHAKPLRCYFKKLETAIVWSNKTPFKSCPFYIQRPDSGSLSQKLSTHTSFIKIHWYF